VGVEVEFHRDFPFSLFKCQEQDEKSGQGEDSIEGQVRSACSNNLPLVIGSVEYWRRES